VAREEDGESGLARVVHLPFPSPVTSASAPVDRLLVEPVGPGASDDRDALDLVGPEVDDLRWRLLILAVRLALEPVERLTERRGRPRRVRLADRSDRDRSDIAERLPVVVETEFRRDAGGVAEVGMAIEREARRTGRGRGLRAPRPGRTSGP